MAYMSRRLFEEADFTSSFRGLRAAAVAGSHVPFRASLSAIDFGEAIFEIVRGTPLLLLETAAEDRVGFKLLLDGASGATWDGKPASGNDIALFGRGGQHEAAYPDPFACAFVSFPTSGLDATSALPDGLTRQLDRPLPTRSAHPRTHACIAAVALAAEQAAELASGSPGTEEAHRSLFAALLDGARRLLAPEPAWATALLRRQRASARRRIVRRADEYLCANLARPIYTEDLCVALGVSESSLHEAFEATFGVSPHRYLKLRRLAMVRSMLLSRSAPWHSVKVAALSHGFWHLGQFAHDYREVFGEPLSVMLACAR